MNVSSNPGDEFPFHGDLLSGGQAAEWLARAIAKAREPVSICSAFLRSEAISRSLEGLSSGLTGKLLVRWRLDDLLAGASDLASYELATSLGWGLYMRLDFHGKVYEIPGQGILVGSANATGSGFGFSARSNTEACTLVPDSPNNRKVTVSFFEGATYVTPSLFSELALALESCSDKASLRAEWPEAIMKKLLKPKALRYLLVSSCLLSKPDWVGKPAQAPGVDAIHDLALLGVPANADSALLRVGLSKTAIFLWLIQVVTACGGEIYFGQLSAELHGQLADDPRPQRRDVKTLLQNLLDWISFCEVAEVVIDRPSHSQRIRVVSTKSGSY